MHRVDDLVDVAGLAGPRSRVDNLAFFRVRGNCQSPAIQDGDVVLATWRLLPVEQSAPAQGEFAVFLVRWPGEERAAVVLNRWPCAARHGAPATRSSNTGEAGTRWVLASSHACTACPAESLSAALRGLSYRCLGGGGQARERSERVALLADHVRLVQRGGSFNAKLLAGTVYAGLDLWFAADSLRPQAVKRTLRVAAVYETMASSMHTTTSLNLKAAERLEWREVI